MGGGGLWEGWGEGEVSFESKDVKKGGKLYFKCVRGDGKYGDKKVRKGDGMVGEMG